MELISLQGKTNFFEKRVGEYSKASVTNAKVSKKSDGQTGDVAAGGQRVFSMNEDF